MTARLTKWLCSFAVMLVFLASITCVSASALDNGIYVAKSSPHYKHPVTGVIEDSGGENSQVLGQSMTESALYPEALIEVDPSGKMYATVRLKLMDNIENPAFKVQSRGDSSFRDVSYDIMKEDFSKNQSDFRFEIPNENCIIRATFYVVPMGRDVIFYIDFSDIHEGSSDFVTSVEVKKPETTTTTTVTTTKPAETTSQEQTTSPAVADICDKLELDLVGVCKSNISTIPSRYDNAGRRGYPHNKAAGFCQAGGYRSPVQHRSR